jgi:hypothetical protein
MAKAVYEFDQCEAAKADGTRCKAEGHDYVKNAGAYMGFLVCGTHKRSGEKLALTESGIPSTWGKYNWSRSIL